MFPGSDSQAQIKLIMDFLGSPSEEDMSQIKQPKARSFLSSLPKRDPSNAKVVFPDVKNDKALDLLRKLLVFNPAKRLTTEEALKHPYLEALHCPEDEPVGKPIPPHLMEWEDHFLTLDEYRKLMVNEIKHANAGANETLEEKTEAISMKNLQDALSNDVAGSDIKVKVIYSHEIHILIT